MSIFEKAAIDAGFVSPAPPTAGGLSGPSVHRSSRRLASSAPAALASFRCHPPIRGAHHHPLPQATPLVQKTSCTPGWETPSVPVSQPGARIRD